MKQMLLLTGLLGALLVQAGPTPPAAGEWENFQKDWKAVPAGSAWKISGDTEVQLSHPLTHAKTKASEPVFARAVEQAGVMQYDWSLKQADFKQGCVFYLFSTDPSARNAYAIWLWLATDKASGEKQTRLNVDKIVNHKLTPIKFFPITLKHDDWNSMRVKFDSVKGAFTVWCNGEEVAQCTDPKPFAKGSYVALGSSASSAIFKEVRIQKSP